MPCGQCEKKRRERERKLKESQQKELQTRKISKKIQNRLSK